MQEASLPETLYKIVSISDWQKSLIRSCPVSTDNDKEFIHLAKEDQVSKVAEKFWSGQDYILLKVSPQKLQGKLVLEANPGGSNLYYHLYEGAIPLSAIVDVTVVRAKKE